MSVITAIHLSRYRKTCSIQVLTQRGSVYREFPVSMFRIDRKKGVLQIGENLFSHRGIRLNFEGLFSEEKQPVKVQGSLRFGMFSEPRYDIMGPFAYIPGMECRHAVYSMKHRADGRLKLQNRELYFQNAAGYMEGDSGSSFPEKYIWTQHFFPEGSIMAAAAVIPMGKIRFTGTLGFLFIRNREYRFATYLGAVVEKIGEKELVIRQGHYRLCIRFPEPGEGTLKAPDSGKMTRSVWENIACKVEYTLIYKGRVLLHIATDRGAAEYNVKK